MARAALKWSLKDLQDKTGVSKNTLLRFESGGGVHHSTVQKIEAVFLSEGIAFTDAGSGSDFSISISRDVARRLQE